jgi:phosphoribosyl 1,2-cyclic phosphodiesterase
MLVRFFGVRGSIPLSDLRIWQHGGNTPCVEVETPAGYRIILDGGTGLRALGQAPAWGSDAGPHHACCLLSHYHWDHIQGLPFFAPLYDPRNQIAFFGLPPENGAAMKSALQGQMLKPYFPVDLSALAAAQTFTAVEPGRRWALHDATIESERLHHPQGCLGFRIETECGVVVYATDNEPGDPLGDAMLRHLARDADVLICDAQYAPAMLEKRRGWGHSSWLEATAVAEAAHVRCLLLFHHDPDSDDTTIRRSVRLARERFPETWAAAEGLTIQCQTPHVAVCPTAPRIGPRVPTRIPVRLRGRGADGVTLDVTGSLTNMTLKGTYVVAPEAFEEGSEIEVSWLDENAQETPMHGTVVRIDPRRENRNPGIGIALHVEDRVRQL